MLKCREIVELSSDFLDKELSLRQRLMMRMHITVCRKCSKFMKQLELTIAYFKAWSFQPEIDADMEADIEAIAKTALQSRPEDKSGIQV